MSLNSVATRILERFTSLGDLERVDHAESNLVWMTEDLVLRMSASEGPNNLLREAQLGELLPGEVGYPRVVGAGVEESREWIVTERIRGEHLATKWPAMSDQDRVQTIEALWDRVKWIHRTDVSRAREIGCTHTPFYVLSREGAEIQLSEAAHRGRFDNPMQASISKLLDRGFAAMDAVGESLGHTDVGIHNAIWTGSDAFLIDFEFACVGPEDLDLEMFLRQLLQPSESVVSRRLLELAERDLRRRGARDRLVGYAVQRDLWALLLWFRHADSYGPDRNWPPKDIEQWDPWLRLRAHALNESELSQLW